MFSKSAAIPQIPYPTFKNKHLGAMSGEGLQPKITSRLSRGRKCNARRSEANTQLVYRMNKSDVRPISVVEGEGLEELAWYHDPQ